MAGQKLETLKNRSSTIKWRSNMTEKERKLYDKKIYDNLTKNSQKIKEKDKKSITTV